MRRAILILAAVAAVAGCEGREERNAARCESYGLKPGDQGYAPCMTNLAAVDQQGDSSFWQYMAISHIASSLGGSRPASPSTVIVNGPSYHYSQPAPAATRPAAAPAVRTASAPVTRSTPAARPSWRVPLVGRRSR